MKTIVTKLLLGLVFTIPISVNAKAIASPETVLLIDKSIEAVNHDIENFDSYTNRNEIFMAEPDLENLKLIKTSLDKVKADLNQPNGKRDYKVSRQSFYIEKKDQGYTYKLSPFPFPCVALMGCIKPPSSEKSPSYKALLELNNHLKRQKL